MTGDIQAMSLECLERHTSHCGVIRDPIYYYYFLNPLLALKTSLSSRNPCVILLRGTVRLRSTERAVRMRPAGVAVANLLKAGSCRCARRTCSAVCRLGVFFFFQPLFLSLFLRFPPTCSYFRFPKQRATAAFPSRGDPLAQAN